MTATRTTTALMITLLATSGCVVAAGGGADMVDETVITSSIVAGPANSADQSDQTTLRNAVSAADLVAHDGKPLFWANAETGASGVITAINEVRAGDTICRSFRTSRQRFDGVAVYDGEACTKGRGEWTLTRFAEGE